VIRKSVVFIHHNNKRAINTTEYVNEQKKQILQNIVQVSGYYVNNVHLISIAVDTGNTIVAVERTIIFTTKVA